jgi:molybdopterin molybdotransferase
VVNESLSYSQSAPPGGKPRSILPPDMISVEEARERILAHFAPLEAVSTPLGDALGLVLAEDVYATFNIPPLTNTAMDGYAVRASDTAGATPEAPVVLPVSGYLAAGSVFDGAVAPGEAVRIMTGAPLPDGADAVVPFEETDEQERGIAWHLDPQAIVRIDVAARRGANLRVAGEDVRTGELVLPRGTVIGPAQVGVLASLGLAEARVVRRPRVAILSTGDELLRPGEPLAPGKIYDANAFSLAAQVRAWGGEARVLEIARDTIEALTASIHEGLRDADLVVTSAGVSRGDFDVVKDVLGREGEIGFWTIRMRPGKPLAFGVLRGEGRTVPHLGLPGNPVSAMLTFELFGRAALFTMLGKPQLWPRPTVRGVALDRLENTDGRRFYARCLVSEEGGRYVARLTGPQGSGVLTSMAFANAYAVCPEGVPAIEPGDECEIILVDQELPPTPPPRTR